MRDMIVKSIKLLHSEHIEANYADVCVSPTRQYEDTMEDYDWHDVSLPYDEIEELIKLSIDK